MTSTMLSAEDASVRTWGRSALTRTADKVAMQRMPGGELTEGLDPVRKPFGRLRRVVASASISTESPSTAARDSSSVERKSVERPPRHAGLVDHVVDLRRLRPHFGEL